MGWQVRGTSRRSERLEPIEAAGLEPALADPYRPGTVLELCGDVAVVVWLLGNAAGEPDEARAIHGPRLESLMERLVDSPVRAFAYEAVGSVDASAISEGVRIVVRAREIWRVPVVLLTEGRREPRWAERSAAAVAGLLAG
jgi:hypothetical protein